MPSHRSIIVIDHTHRDAHPVYYLVIVLNVCVIVWPARKSNSYKVPGANF